MKEIGGYFEHEKLNFNRQKKHLMPFTPNLQLKSGRASLKWLIFALKCEKIHIPYYICDVVLNLILDIGIKYELYHINEYLEIENIPSKLDDREILLYVNYWGIKRNYIQKLSKVFNQKLIIDNSQDFFWRPSHLYSSSFNSARKFFGVPDGSYLYFNDKLRNANYIIKRNTSFIIKHLMIRAKSNAQKGYDDYIENERMVNSDIELISEYSEKMLINIDYDQVIIKRKINFDFLHSHLGKLNKLNSLIPLPNEDYIPFCYPFQPIIPMPHNYLWNKGIYIPVLWKNIDFHLCNEIEQKLQRDTLYLPIDHRYNKIDMEFIVNQIENFEK